MADLVRSRNERGSVWFCAGVLRDRTGTAVLSGPPIQGTRNTMRVIRVSISGHSSGSGGETKRTGPEKGQYVKYIQCENADKDIHPHTCCMTARERMLAGIILLGIVTSGLPLFQVA
ncbi:hypothetical protein Trydic_g8050 [Trypoxylus dichotomus]